jgi:hypothetical protein
VSTTAGPTLIPVVTTLIAATAALSCARSKYDGHVGRTLGRPDDLDPSSLFGRANRLHRGEGEDLDPL